MRLRVRSVHRFKRHLKHFLKQKKLTQSQFNELNNKIDLISTHLDSSTLLHCINSAFIVLKLGLDFKSVKAALLHHSDNDVLSKMKDKETKLLVNEMKMFKAITDKNVDLRADDLSAILIASCTDLRSIIIFIATVLDGLRQLGPKDKELARRINEVFYPLVHKLGLTDLIWEFDDLPLKILDFQTYYKIKKLVKHSRRKREQISARLGKRLNDILAKNNINAVVYSRVKSFYSIYRKMNRGKKFDELGDLIAHRVICNSIEDCYIILGLVNGSCKTTSHFHDFIEKPKSTGYQSIHISVNYGNMISEIQIRTWRMHFNAELGSAAHWKYKELKENPLADDQISVIRQLVELQKRVGAEFARKVDIDLKRGKVFVFTPKRQIIVLPEGSTIIDFAFALHTDLGLKCLKAIMNDKPVSLDYKLRNFDRIEIIPSANYQARESWLSIVASSKARSKLRSFLGIKKAAPRTEGPIATTSKNKIIQAFCCKPLPDDPTIAVKTTKRKLILHKDDCANLKIIDPSKMVRLKKIPMTQLIGPLKTTLQIKTVNYPGVLIELLEICSRQRMKITKTEAKTKGAVFQGNIELELTSPDELQKIKKAIKKDMPVVEIKRI